jgi:hypothetical protein
MTDLEKFDAVWNGHSCFNGKRGRSTRKKYESILFSIWKHHNDWDSENGFQIKCFKSNAIYRVVRLAEEAGLLIKTRNYYAGDHTNEYHKNIQLFQTVFQGDDNHYGKWLNTVNNERYKQDYDIIYRLYQDEFNKLNYKYRLPYVATDILKEGKRNIYKKLKYDIRMLHDMSDRMFDKYYKMLVELNSAAVHEELKFITFIHYDKRGLPTGRPYSYFCSTGNDKKKHKDPSLELRSQFLQRIGLADYYEVYDIKSEVPRVNYLFHTGEWKDDSYDFYTEIIKDTEMINYLDWQVDRGQTQYTDHEDSMKQLFMRIYFGKGSIKQSFNGYQRNKLDRMQNNYKQYWDDIDDKLAIDFDIWQELCRSTKKICGPPLGNLIFWFTFFLETEVKIELLRRGKTVYNVYDGFYYNKDIKDEIRELLEAKSKYIYNEYMIHLKKKYHYKKEWHEFDIDRMIYPP